MRCGFIKPMEANIMNWLFRFLENRTIRMQREDINSFNAALSTISDVEMGELAAISHFIKIGLKEAGNDPMLPFEAVIRNGELPTNLAKTVILYKKQGNHIVAAGFSVWTHTIRAALRPELLPEARGMWKHLSRGFPHVAQAAVDIQRRLSISIDVGGADRVPPAFD